MKGLVYLQDKAGLVAQPSLTDSGENTVAFSKGELNVCVCVCAAG